MTPPDAPANAALPRVAVLGAGGRMGRAAVEAIQAAPDLELVAELGRHDPLVRLLEARAEIIVDLTVPAASEQNVRFAVQHDLHAVVGTTGWDEGQRDRLRGLLAEHPGVGVLIAPNFALGSVLATRFAAQAAKYFSSVEIIELHHPQKIDAPSGTAMRTAELIAEARQGVAPALDATESAQAGARGADVSGVPVHSVRLAGLTAHQEVLLGSPGEQLSLRHDSFGRESFMPGILLALRAVTDRPGLSYGLDSYLDLEG
ncbi:4-hydroxy-tetrahydrodipicolinate reductase [Acaricomes phytoseiuli]|uniref:4-hydroxy-tetrahydrodipicolinate reductase n=1 Tax=Acaricomes phytoseiuli TaxID=291968 RepID=UPI00035F33DE|nr:4-hydroxy-tetrahydrodipicolinate reductase [Acaricomes phytoseiuli]MCW1248799.1 4-hydroxy-tetrahydrodipicolinate reductase [Acaricomes phytoseiuli]